MRFQIVAFMFVASLGVASRVAAQGADVFGSPANGSTGNNALEANEGLQSATPTDNVNELNTGNGALDDGEGGDFEFSGEGDFDAAGDELFDDQAASGQGEEALLGPGANAPDAFGNPSAVNPAAASNAVPTAPTQVPTVNAAVTNPAPPVQTAPVQSAPAQFPTVQQAAPANAQTLMNEIVTDPAAAVPPTTAATGEEVAPPPVGPPAIEAPPLPPPNEFSGAPPIPGSMRLMADGEAPEEYRVQPGDTLFDICDQLLDEPAYWPKLWALNPEIKNPHFIFPNMRLQFYPGDDDTPPYLQVVTEDDVIPIDKGDLDEQLLVAEKVNFVIETPEEEMPVEVVGPEGIGEELSDDLLLSGRIYDGQELKLQVPGFIFAEEKEPIGTVRGGRNDEAMISSDMAILVEDETGVSVGTTYTILRPGEKIKSPETGDFVGYKYYFVANVRMDRELDDDVFVGTVRDSRLGVMKDDIIVSFISTFRSAPPEHAIGSLSQAEANIVGFEYEGQDVGATGQYAFLDKGTGDGISTGMYLGIYGTPGTLTRDMRSLGLPEDYQMVGVVRIIDTTDAGAIGYVVKTMSEIRIGDRAGKG